MNQDLVIGIDSSTSATKAIVWDRAGRAVAEGRAPIAMSNPEPGFFEQHPNDWWRSTAEALKEVTAKVDPGRIAAAECVEASFVSTGATVLAHVVPTDY